MLLQLYVTNSYAQITNSHACMLYINCNLKAIFIEEGSTMVDNTTIVANIESEFVRETLEY